MRLALALPRRALALSHPLRADHRRRLQHARRDGPGRPPDRRRQPGSPPGILTPTPSARPLPGRSASRRSPTPAGAMEPASRPPTAACLQRLGSNQGYLNEEYADGCISATLALGKGGRADTKSQRQPDCIRAFGIHAAAGEPLLLGRRLHPHVFLFRGPPLRGHGRQYLPLPGRLLVRHPGRGRSLQEPALQQLDLLRRLGAPRPCASSASSPAPAARSRRPAPRATSASTEPASAPARPRPPAPATLRSAARPAPASKRSPGAPRTATRPAS
jgi:hypothetical protein